MKRNILQYLEETAQRVPDRCAFFDDREQLTFSGLLSTARSVGTALAKVTRTRRVVALLIDARSIHNLPAMFGVVAAGCAYAPLDITMPPERLTLLLTLMQPAAILADEKGAKVLHSCGKVTAPLVMMQDAEATAEDAEKLAEIRSRTSVYDPMSVLYTSGSTGIPKGSVQTHFSYIHWTEATISVYGMTENVVFGNQSPFFYANSLLEIFPPVALGAPVYLLPAGVLTFPKKMVQCLRDRHVSVLCMTPSSFVAVANAGVLTPGCLPELRWGIMSGESMPWLPLCVWMEATPNANWWHFYGSTEMFSVAVGKVDPNKAPEGRLPVGKPFELAHILFVDENGEETAPGVPGEMLVSSPWIAGGYHRDAERTASSWVVDPLNRGWYERFFRAGDIGYLREDGQLMVMGRRDLQIKHMGYRMELGEVEAALGTVKEVAEGCILYDAEKDHIWCFYAGSADEKQLKQALREKLARYMLPDIFVRLDAMPHTANMKIDRVRLKQQMK